MHWIHINLNNFIIRNRIKILTIVIRNLFSRIRSTKTLKILLKMPITQIVLKWDKLVKTHNNNYNI